MQQSPDRIGRCQECGSALFGVPVLVEYETDDGLNYYAECPDCETVVHPE
ncbi:DUF7837 family putative zinc-binding protein [Halosimplex amylolyticum]